MRTGLIVWQILASSPAEDSALQRGKGVSRVVFAPRLQI